jgi:hypothetical protein
MNDMKKTIAILLVLVIGMAGVFAEDTSTAIAELDLTTTIDLVFRTKLVATANKLESLDFTNFEAASALLTSQTVDLNTADFGYLYIMTNNAAGYELSIEADPLTSTDIATSINYVISAGGASYDTADTGATATTVTSLAISALDVDEYTVSVDLDETTYNAALPASYTADVAFTFTAQ